MQYYKTCFIVLCYVLCFSGFSLSKCHHEKRVLRSLQSSDASTSKGKLSHVLMLIIEYYCTFVQFIEWKAITLWVKGLFKKKVYSSLASKASKKPRVLWICVGFGDPYNYVPIMAGWNYKGSIWLLCMISIANFTLNMSEIIHSGIITINFISAHLLTSFIYYINDHWFVFLFEVS